jgi:hypothetical protein
VTITSLTYTEGFAAQGKEETWHDFSIGPGIGGDNGWKKGTPDGGVWWGSDIWAGEVLRIQSNLPILVLGGDYDVPHFGAFTPYFAPGLPTITVVKEVKGTSDDTTSFDFTFEDEDFALKSDESKLFENLVAGSYTVTETVPDDWLLTKIECDNGYEQTDPDEPQVTVDLRWAEDVVCTFTNEPKAPSIEVVKEVEGTDDDTTSFDFTFVDEDFALKNGESKLFEDLVAGTYTVTETVPDNWLLTGITCDNGYEQTNPDPPQVIVDVDWAEHVVCTFTNEPKLPSIEIKKEVKGTDDTTTSFDFTFVDEDFSLKHGESKLFEDLAAGTYTITETVPDSWLLAEITCDNGIVETNPDPPRVIVEVGLAEEVVCTFTNEIVTAVELTSFSAKAGSDSVTLSWVTASEIDNEGFNVWRSESADGTYTKLNASLIPARGNADAGADYEYTDTDVVQDTTYFYKLEDVDSHGASTFHGPESATPTRTWRIFLPFVTGAIMLPGAAIWQRKNRPS